MTASVKHSLFGKQKLFIEKTFGKNKNKKEQEQEKSDLPYQPCKYVERIMSHIIPSNLILDCQTCAKSKPEGLKSSRAYIYLILVNDVVSVARKKSFHSSRLTGFVFSSHNVQFRYLKLVKQPA